MTVSRSASEPKLSWAQSSEHEGKSGGLSAAAANQPVVIWVVVGTLHGCERNVLNDAEHMAKVLADCTVAGGLTLLHSHVHQFKPQGVTATAVLAESHIALHSWPEQGVLFVDIATCSSAESSRAAFRKLCSLVTHSTQKIQEITAGSIASV